MVTVLGSWETSWMDAARTERRLWKQTLQAFAVRSWGMWPVQGGPFTAPVQYASLQDMLDSYPGQKTFLIPPGRVPRAVSLTDYEHPRDAVYVFGSTPENLVRCVRSSDDVVSVDTPSKSDLFGHVVLGMVLYDRMGKQRERR